MNTAISTTPAPSVAYWIRTEAGRFRVLAPPTPILEAPPRRSPDEVRAAVEAEIRKHIAHGGEA